VMHRPRDRAAALTGERGRDGLVHTGVRDFRAVHRVVALDTALTCSLDALDQVQDPGSPRRIGKWTRAVLVSSASASGSAYRWAEAAIWTMWFSCTIWTSKRLHDRPGL
jgi:hypothetical protein